MRSTACHGSRCHDKDELAATLNYYPELKTTPREDSPVFKNYHTYTRCKGTVKTAVMAAIADDSTFASDLCRGQEARRWRFAQGELHHLKVKRQGLYESFKSAFLPEGYPASVPADYFGFQVWDTLQATCSYIRGLLATKAILIGVGVGKQVRLFSMYLFLILYSFCCVPPHLCLVPKLHQISMQAMP